MTAILQANDTRDLADDRAGGIRTLSILLGPSGARGFCDILLFAPYVALVRWYGRAWRRGPSCRRSYPCRWPSGFTACSGDTGGNDRSS